MAITYSDLDPLVKQFVALYGGGPLSAFTTSQVALSTTPASVAAASTTRLYLEVKNLDASINVIVGPADTLTAGNGYVIGPGGTFSFGGFQGAVWARSASGTPTLAIFSGT